MITEESSNLKQKLKDSIRESFIDEKIDQNTPYFDANSDENLRAKTSLRMTYEAQVQVLKGQLGDLESIRERLGLSQRKMAQLLLVDPSSWTRWTKKGDEAPPQIWRALQWYLALQGKIPGLNNQYFLSESSRSVELKSQKEVKEIKETLSLQLGQLKKELRMFKALSMFLFVGNLLFLLWFFLGFR